MSVGCLLGPVGAIVLDVLRSEPIVSTSVSGRIFDNTPQPPTWPYIRVESAEETSLNTMGGNTQPSRGSEVTVRIRVCSQFRGESEVNDICSKVRDVLDGHREAIAGYGGRPIFEYKRTAPLQDSVGAVVTREWIMEFDLAAHQ